MSSPLGERAATQASINTDISDEIIACRFSITRDQGDHG
jgi:hypothetical protein